jgi:hypothetical protein
MATEVNLAGWFGWQIEQQAAEARVSWRQKAIQIGGKREDYHNPDHTY